MPETQRFCSGRATPTYNIIPFPSKYLVQLMTSASNALNNKAKHSGKTHQCFSHAQRHNFEA